MFRARVFSYLHRINEATLKSHPLATNVAFSCCVAATSDYIAQKFIQGHQTLDTQRTRHMVTYNCTTAPIWHMWYKQMDHYLKQSQTWLKVVLDQTTITPIDYLGFFAVFNYVKGDSIEKCIAELNRVYLKALIPDTIFWPFMTFMGYKFIPLQYRFIYFELVDLVWCTFLSYLKYAGNDEINTEVSPVNKSLSAGNGTTKDSQ